MGRKKTVQLSFTEVLRKRLKEPPAHMQFVVGPRQVGKTTGVEMALQDFDSSVVHYVLVEGHPGHNREWLKEQWWYAQSLGPGTLLVVDEIQKVEGWAETVKYLWDQSKSKKTQLTCVFLGSSSLDLFQGVSESLAGRYELIQVPHWDFSTSQLLVKSLSWKKYLKMGGYPGSYAFLSEPSRWRNYLLQSIIENVLTKDIFSMSTVRKPALFRQLVELLCSYPAQEISYTKLLGQIQESGNVEIIKYYLSLLQGAFLFYSLEKYSPKRVLQKASSPKIIPMCPALIEALSPEVDEGRRFEAYVGSQLIRLGGSVYYWRERNFEVDFVYKNEKGQIFAVEVKAGKKKHSKSLSEFLERSPSARPVIIDQNNVHRLDELVGSRRKLVT